MSRLEIVLLVVAVICLVVLAEIAVAWVRRWCNGMLPARVPSPVKAPARIVSPPYDWSLEDARGVALASAHTAFEAHSARLPELFSPMSKTDHAVDQRAAKQERKAAANLYPRGSVIPFSAERRS